LSKRCIAPLAACIALAVPASASAHARTPTVALDYRLVLDRISQALPGVDVAILDGDRDIRLDVSRGNVVVLGDLGEQMLRVGAAGAYANTASPTAAAARLVRPGKGWRRVGGSSFAWHDHRLSPPPYSTTPGPAGRFAIPALVNGRRVTFGGTFLRTSRPSAWPWMVGCLVATVALVALLWIRPRRRATLALVTGSVAVAAALTALVTFNAADAPNGRVAWAQIVLGCGLAAVGAAGLIKLRGESRIVLAGVLGIAAAVSSIGSLGVYRHGVVVSLLSAGVARAVAAIAICAGLAAAATLFVRDGAAT
jgi:hypothetical protein